MERIGEYEVRRLVGEGGMGKVYEAEERLSGRVVALKVLRNELSHSESGRDLFLNEMKILANLEHPTIVRSLASFEHEDSLVLVLEYLDGETLRERLGDGPLPWADAVAIASRVASALAAAHGQRPPIVHRDLKPDNIMCVGELYEEPDDDEDEQPVRIRPGAVKVMDFGIAKVLEHLTRTHTQSVGTLQYMSPEQIDARNVDGRSDLYSLGLVIYEMISGAPPFSSPSPRELLNLQCTAKPPPLDTALRESLPDGLEPLLLQLLSKDPDDRPDTASGVQRRLERILERASSVDLVVKEGASRDSPATSSDDADAETATEDADDSDHAADEAASADADEAGAESETEPGTEPAKDDDSAHGEDAREEERDESLDTRHLVEGTSDGAARASKKSTKGTSRDADHEGRSSLKQMLIVTGIAFAVGALLLFVFDPLGGRRSDSSGTGDGGGDGTGPVDTPPEPPDTDPALKGVVPPRSSTTDSSLSDTHRTPEGTVAQLIRDGTFLLGTNPPAGDPDEQPQKSMAIGDFYIDTTEVTVDAFQQCVDDGTCTRNHFTPSSARSTCNFGASGRGQHPMNCVSAEGAAAFCRWRSSKDDTLAYRLPSEAEWEKAARGDDGRTFPWGDQAARCSLAAIGGCGLETSGEVASTPSDVSPHGVMDLGGRVSEWVIGVYDEHVTDTAEIAAAPRTLRGGNWRTRTPIRAADRDAVPVPLDFGTDDIGFRCAAVPN